MPAASIAVNPSSPAPLWRRLACLVYDLFPVVALWILAAGLWMLAFRHAYDPRHPDIALRALLDAWLLVVAGAYFVVSWVRVGQTIGMRAWKLKLVRDDGTRIGIRLAIVRGVLAVLSFVAVGCGFWYAWFDADRRTWHDRVCGTRMIRL